MENRATMNWECLHRLTYRNSLFNCRLSLPNLGYLIISFPSEVSCGNIQRANTVPPITFYLTLFVFINFIYIPPLLFSTNNSRHKALKLFFPQQLPCEVIWAEKEWLAQQWSRSAKRALTELVVKPAAFYPGLKYKNGLADMHHDILHN